MNGRESPPEWPIRQEPTDEAPVDSGPRRRAPGPNWTTLALIAALILLVLLVAYLATSRDPDQDKLTGAEHRVNSGSAADPAKLCASKGTYDLIKRELFRRATQERGSDQAAFDKLSAYASLRMENPVMESEDSASKAVNCSASLSLDLPPGVAVVGGRRTLSTDVDYTVQPAADSSGNVVLLRNADAVVTPLATLARTAEPQAPTTVQPNTPAPTERPEATVETPESANKPVGPQVTGSARPSFNCAAARTKGEIAVCSDNGLAGLDVNMASQYRQALTAASPEQRALLERTRNRFIAYRDRCPNRSCMADAYVGRMREIRDIMEGRWQPER